MGRGHIPIIEGAVRVVEDRICLLCLRDETPKQDAGTSRGELRAEAMTWA